MADELEYKPGDTGSYTVLYNGTTQILESESGWDNPEDNPIIADSPDRLIKSDQGVGFKPRVYVAKFHIIGTSMSNLESLRRAWDQLHLPYRGEGTIKRIRADGTTRYLDARPRRGKWSDRQISHERVEQAYTAANPWWYSAQVTASDSFNGNTPVNISCANAGEIPTRPVITITGIAHTPKLTNSDGDVIEISNATVNADDVLVIDCRRGIVDKVLYYEHGAGDGVAWFGYRTSATKLWMLPTGTNNVAIVGAVGETSTATCQIAWYNRYGSL